MSLHGHFYRRPASLLRNVLSTKPDIQFYENLGVPRFTLLPAANAAQVAGKVLIRADRRESFRATVLAWITPLPEARCISGCAACNAAAAADLSPVAIATSTFLTKVLMRDFRAIFRAVRVAV